MFRVSEHCSSGRLVLKLEGRCSFEIVGELDAGWRAAVRKAGSDQIVVDLSDVWLVDEQGRAQLARMQRDGARLVSRGCLMEELIREIGEQARQRTERSGHR